MSQPRTWPVCEDPKYLLRVTNYLNICRKHYYFFGQLSQSVFAIVVRLAFQRLESCCWIPQWIIPNENWKYYIVHHTQRWYREVELWNSIWEVETVFKHEPRPLRTVLELIIWRGMTKSSICGVTKAQKFGSGTIKLASSVFSEGKKRIAQLLSVKQTDYTSWPNFKSFE